MAEKHCDLGARRQPHNVTDSFFSAFDEEVEKHSEGLCGLDEVLLPMKLGTWRGGFVFIFVLCLYLFLFVHFFGLFLNLQRLMLLSFTYVTYGFCSHATEGNWWNGCGKCLIKATCLIRLSQLRNSISTNYFIFTTSRLLVPSPLLVVLVLQFGMLHAATVMQQLISICLGLLMSVSSPMSSSLM